MNDAQCDHEVLCPECVSCLHRQMNYLERGMIEGQKKHLEEMEALSKRNMDLAGEIYELKRKAAGERG